MARGWIVERVGAKSRGVFPFMGDRCDRVVLDVLARLAELSDGPSQIQ
jgi:RNA polymerase sigma-70 factor (ECF subfamily)